MTPGLPERALGLTPGQLRPLASRGGAGSRGSGGTGMSYNWQFESGSVGQGWGTDVDTGWATWNHYDADTGEITVIRYDYGPEGGGTQTEAGWYEEVGPANSNQWQKMKDQDPLGQDSCELQDDGITLKCYKRPPHRPPAPSAPGSSLNDSRSGGGAVSITIGSEEPNACACYYVATVEPVPCPNFDPSDPSTWPAKSSDPNSSDSNTDLGSEITPGEGGLGIDFHGNLHIGGSAVGTSKSDDNSDDGGNIFDITTW